MLEAYILRELSVLKLANHENIVNYIGAYNDTNQDEEGFCASYIVTELCYGGDLLRLLQNSDVRLSWKLRLRIAWQTADALHFLHSMNLVHRDIKSSVSSCIRCLVWLHCCIDVYTLYIFHFSHGGMITIAAYCSLHLSDCLFAVVVGCCRMCCWTGTGIAKSPTSASRV